MGFRAATAPRSMASFCGHLRFKWSVAPVNLVISYVSLGEYHIIYRRRRWDRFLARFGGRNRLGDRFVGIRSILRKGETLVRGYQSPSRHLIHRLSVFVFDFEVFEEPFCNLSSCGLHVHNGSIF